MNPASGNNAPGPPPPAHPPDEAGTPPASGNAAPVRPPPARPPGEAGTPPANGNDAPDWPTGDAGTVSPARRARLLRQLLKSVSRSFYLSLRILPDGPREPAGLAYLLARAADTLADTRTLPPEQRLIALQAFRRQLTGPAIPGELPTLTAGFDAAAATPGEAALLAALPDALALLAAQPAPDRQLICGVVDTLTQGMEFDLTRFPAEISPPEFPGPESSGQIAALETAAELDRYVYLVAGCVGEFWTALCRRHDAALAGWDMDEMAALGVQFGKALQLTNVLRDVPRDLRMGRCYLPMDELTAAGLTPAALLTPQNSGPARPLLRRWLLTALAHFEAAEAYLLAIPRRRIRLRLAAYWPLALGLMTLALLARRPDDWLAPQRPARVRRRQVYALLLRSVPIASSDTLLRRHLRHLRRRVEAAL